MTSLLEIVKFINNRYVFWPKLITLGDNNGK